MATHQHDEDLIAARDAVVKTQQANDETIASLARIGVQVDQSSFAMMRLLILVDSVLGPFDGNIVSADRVRYEQKVQARFAELLADAQTQVARQRLLEGVSGQQVAR